MCVLSTMRLFVFFHQTYSVTLIKNVAITSKRLYKGIYSQTTLCSFDALIELFVSMCFKHIPQLLVNPAL